MALMEHVFTPKERRTFQNICHLTERGVLAMMADFLRTKYDNVISTPSYILALGSIPVALVAHADTFLLLLDFKLICSICFAWSILK